MSHSARPTAAASSTISGRSRSVRICPGLSSFTYLESPDGFGCGAGLTHLYVDGSGELCPCNLVPLSFGNIQREPLDAILGRMGEHFRLPRPACAGRTLSPFLPDGPLPTPPRASCELCKRHLPAKHGLPLFFKVRGDSLDRADAADLRRAYDRIGRHYDDFWVVEAGKPVRRLVASLKLKGNERGLRGRLRLRVRYRVARPPAAGRVSHRGRSLADDARRGPAAARRNSANSLQSSRCAGGIGRSTRRRPGVLVLGAGLHPAGQVLRRDGPLAGAGPGGWRSSSTARTRRGPPRRSSANWSRPTRAS